MYAYILYSKYVTHSDGFVATRRKPPVGAPAGERFPPMRPFGERRTADADKTKPFTLSTQKTRLLKKSGVARMKLTEPMPDFFDPPPEASSDSKFIIFWQGNPKL